MRCCMAPIPDPRPDSGPRLGLRASPPTMCGLEATPVGLPPRGGAT